MRDLGELLEEGRRLHDEIGRDCRSSRLATTFSSGFADVEPSVTDPIPRVRDWTERLAAAMGDRLGDSEGCFTGPVARPRKPLETESAYAATCLRARLRALEAVVAGMSREGWLGAVSQHGIRERPSSNARLRSPRSPLSAQGEN